MTAALAGAALCLALGACKTMKKGDDVIDYTSPDTGLSSSEYPFDEKGNYREDWASGGRTKDVASNENIYSDPAPAVEVEKPKPKVTSSSGGTAVKTTAGSGAVVSKPKPKTVAAKKPAPKKKVVVKPKPKPVAKPTYVTVRSKDTLSAISRRTGYSVATIKSYNGLRSDFIKPGQTLKLPPKKR
jgi:LysM repeat protein